MTRFFRIISAIFSPLAVPCYGIAFALCITFLSAIPLLARIGVIAMCAVLLLVLPASAVFILYKAGYIKDPGLNIRTERTIPYCFTMVCYLACAYYLYRLSAPAWLVAVPTGGLLAIAINLVINLKWKISGHMAAMGGLLAIDFFIALNHLAIAPMLWPTIIIIICCGLVATARLALNRHTPMQVVAGTANGFISVYLCCLILNAIFPTMP